MKGPVAEPLVQFQRALHHGLDDRQVGNQVRVVFGVGDGGGPGGAGPVEQRHVLDRGQADRLFRGGAQGGAEAAMPDLEPAQAVIARPQIKPPRPPAQGLRRRQVLVLRFL